MYLHAGLRRATTGSEIWDVARGGNLRHGPRRERHVGGRSWFRENGQSLWAEFGVAWGDGKVFRRIVGGRLRAAPSGEKDRRGSACMPSGTILSRRTKTNFSSIERKQDVSRYLLTTIMLADGHGRTDMWP